MANETVIRAHQAAGAYRRLRFESFDAPAQEAQQPAPPAAQPQAQVVPEVPAPPASEAQVPPADPRELAPGVRLPTAEEIEAMHAQAAKDGYDAGYEDGSARGRREAAELHQLLSAFQESLSAMDSAIADELLAASLEIARLVVREEIKARPETILTVVREALTQMPQQHAQVHVHPEDAQLVRQYLGEQITHAGQRIVEDEHIERGGCRIDSAGTQVDASVATRWRRVIENLSREHRWDDEPA
ncbi:flagellar assembly protein FliH [Niveibacterium sp. SC-1]|uniref:flagellar assembly protein FliH n=1 Tax=Niveibacterium sp. SC-1 TaxID=3135646 RepID=UPI00311D902A